MVRLKVIKRVENLKVGVNNMSRRKIAVDKKKAAELEKQRQEKRSNEISKFRKNLNKLKADKREVWSNWSDKSGKISKEKSKELSKGPKGIEKSKADDIAYFKKAVNDETRNVNLQNIARSYSANNPEYAYKEKLGTLPKRIDYLETRNKLRKDDPKIVGMKHGGQACRGGRKATRGTKFSIR